MKLIEKPPRGLRQRQRADGSWRLWWEPTATARNAGLENVELDADRPTWSIRQCRDLNAAADGKPVTQKPRGSTGGHTISALIHEYLHSHLFIDNLKIDTQKGYRVTMALIDRKWGKQMTNTFTKPVIYQWYETLKNTSGNSYAAMVIRSFSILFSYAELLGWRPAGSNPAFNLRLVAPPKRRRTATWDEFDALMIAAGEMGMPQMQTAIALATLQGQRQKDVIEAQIDHFFRAVPPGATDECLIWQFIRSKRRVTEDLDETDRIATLPVHPEAVPLVMAALRTAVVGQKCLLIDHATAAPMTGDLFRKRWAKIRARVALTMPDILSLQFRDLRRTFGVWARQGGVSKSDSADVLGNSAGTNPTLGERYMPPTYATTARAIGAVQRPQKRNLK